MHKYNLRNTTNTTHAKQHENEGYYPKQHEHEHEHDEHEHEQATHAKQHENEGVDNGLKETETGADARDCQAEQRELSPENVQSIEIL